MWTSNSTTTVSKLNSGSPTEQRNKDSVPSSWFCVYTFIFNYLHLKCSQRKTSRSTNRFDISWTLVLSYSLPRARPEPAICQRWQNPVRPGRAWTQPGSSLTGSASRTSSRLLDGLQQLWWFLKWAPECNTTKWSQLLKYNKIRFRHFTSVKVQQGENTASQVIHSK